MSRGELSSKGIDKVSQHLGIFNTDGKDCCFGSLPNIQANLVEGQGRSTHSVQSSHGWTGFLCDLDLRMCIFNYYMTVFLK